MSVNWPIRVTEVRCWHTRAGKGEIGSATGPASRQLALKTLHMLAGFGAGSTQPGKEDFRIATWTPSVHFRELLYKCWRMTGKIIWGTVQERTKARGNIQ